MDWMDEIASESVLQQAYAWLCERRLDYSPNDDVSGMCAGDGRNSAQGLRTGCELVAIGS